MWSLEPVSPHPPPNIVIIYQNSKYFMSYHISYVAIILHIYMVFWQVKRGKINVPAFFYAMSRGGKEQKILLYIKS